jgi:SagB-type dehydrogenase family enzyme
LGDARTRTRTDPAAPARARAAAGAADVSKLAWVLLPLLLAAAGLAALALRRRLPSRWALNAVSSLLLLAYLAVTAGLGLFWVANQQLPPFDWHYLFGYATLALVALHLVFNLPTVWRWLRRPATAAAPVPRRRPLGSALALLGAAAGLAAAFGLGRRQGRTEVRLAGGGPAAGDDLALVERFHALTSHTRQGVLRQAAGADWGDPPPPFKAYRGHPRLALPRDQGTGALLWHVAGVRERRGGIAFRTAPSSGALFSTELYLLVRQLPDVAAGLWHYDADGHALERLALRPPPPAELGLDGPPPPALLVATAVFRRSGHKYRDRTYRYVLADLGHALENLRAVARQQRLALTLMPGFDGGRMARLLGVDEREEGVLAVAWLGDDGPGPALGAAAAAAWAPALAASSGPLGLTDAMHRASSLRRMAGAAAVAVAPGATPTAGGIALPPAAPAAADVRPLIARRRSWRRFAPTPLSAAQLSALLQAMAAAPPQLSDAIRIDVLTAAVQGLPARAWRHDAAAHRLWPRAAPAGALRRAARAAALDQDVVGDAAVVFVLSADRHVLAADALGPARGYRHALLEAGLVGERAYLQATALGLGVCGVGAFYDDEISALAAVDPAREWVLHLVAVGVAA